VSQAAAASPLLAQARQSLGQLPRWKGPGAKEPAASAPSDTAAPPPGREPRPEPIRLTEPAPVAEPIRSPEPIRMAEPARVPEPIRMADPPRSVAPPAPPVKPARPPTSFADLPVIALAEMNEPAREEEDEFDDGPVSRMRDGLGTAWAWVKSLTVIAILLAVIVLLVQNYKVWFPRAMGTTMRVFSRMDEWKARVAPPQASREALEAAREQLPQLSEATIEAIMVHGGLQALPPTEVFRRATEAVARGKASFAPTAAGELDSHVAALLAGLTEPEAERLRGYLDRVGKGEAATLPHEDNEAMWLMARGARRLPGDRLARVQQLSAQAVTVGLGSKPAPEDPSLPSLPPLPSLPAFEGPSR
jgi:hypothetical protein